MEVKYVWSVIFTLVAILFIISIFFAWPIYSVWQRGLAGEAELKQAEWNRQIKIREAAATEESAKHLANAEVERAKGVAKANAIIGESLHNNEAYLRWLWIEGTKEHQNKVIIYVPTEANLPIMEAGRLPLEHGAPKVPR
jgi:regulator of protease activity HflC (stomatin/prohibitin superfamily)